MSSAERQGRSPQDRQNPRLFILQSYYRRVIDDAERSGVRPSQLMGSDARSVFGRDWPQPSEEDTYTYVTQWGELKLNVPLRLATTPLPAPNIVRLTGVQTSMLETLMRDPYRVHRFDRFTDENGDSIRDNWELRKKRVRVHVSNLRRRLGHTEETPLIHTVVGEGYSLTPNVEFRVQEKSR